MTAALPKPQQLAETGNTAAVLQELMPSEFLGSSARLDVDAQADAEESLELLGELLGLLEARGAVGGDEVEGLEGLLVEVGRLGLDHLDGHDAQRPDVDFAAVLLLLDDFGRHPVGRADHGGALGALLRQFGAEAEVGDFHVAARGEQDVVRFDVAVDDVLGVQMHEALASLFCVSIRFISRRLVGHTS